MKPNCRYLVPVLLILFSFGCNSGGDQDKCKPPMFSLGAVLSDDNNTGFTGNVSIRMGVRSHSSVAEISNVIVSVKCPKEVTIAQRIVHDPDVEILEATVNSMTWIVKSVRPYKGKDVAIPVRIVNGNLAGPITVAARLDYKQLAGCDGSEMEEGTYKIKSDLTKEGQKSYVLWRVDPDQEKPYGQMPTGTR